MDSCMSVRMINMSNRDTNRMRMNSLSLQLSYYFIQEMSRPISSTTDAFMTNSDKNCEWK